VKPIYKSDQRKVLPDENDFREKEPKVQGRGFNGPRKAENKGKSLKICELKSHAIAKKSRKHMSVVKSRILQVIKSDLPANLQMKPPNTKCSLPITEPIQEDNIPTHSFQTPPKPVPTPSSLSVRKSTLTKAQDCVVKKPLNMKPKPISTGQEKEMLEISKSASQSQLVKKRKSSPLQIRHVEVFPPLNLVPTALIKPKEPIKDFSNLPPLHKHAKTLIKPENAIENSSNISALVKKVSNPHQPNKPSLKRVFGENNQDTSQSLTGRELNSSMAQNPLKTNTKKFLKLSAKLEQENLLRPSTDNTVCSVSEKNNTKFRTLVLGNKNVLKKEQTSPTKTARLATPSTEILKKVGVSEKLQTLHDLHLIT